MPDRIELPRGPILSVRRIDKSFPGVRALKDVSFDVSAGEVHAVIGENGAGKSTLMRILSGVHPADGGTVLIDDAPVDLRTPSDAFAQGIAMVWQDTRLVPTLDVTWNISLGHEPGGAIFADRGRMAEQARRLLDRIGSDVDPLAPAADLSRAETQQVEIARALSRDARILILDEPTSALTPAETAGLFRVVRALRGEGRSVIFISHRLPEVMEISDRVTVLKDGEVVGTVATAETTPRDLVAMMVGREMGMVFPPRNANPGEAVLTVSGLRTLAMQADTGSLDFIVRAGEVVGFGGIEGSGQQAAARALFGIGRSAGEIAIDGTIARPDAPADAVAAGLVYVPADRRAEGLFLAHSIRENAALPNLAGLSRAGFVDHAAERSVVAEQMRKLAIKARDMESRVDTLSGGNQQKVVFARWLIGDARVVVLDEPTQGVDVGTKQEIYHLIRTLAADGAAVIVISSDLPELIGLTDRILVFSDGGIALDLPSETATEEQVVGAAATAVPAAGGPRTDEVRRVRTARRPLELWFGRYAPAVLLAALIGAMIVATAATAPYFLTSRNFGSMAGQMAPIALAGLGQMATILLGGIDLSIGPTISLVTTIASHLLAPDSATPVWLGIAACLGAGLAVGGLNGVLTAVLRIPDLVATLATFTIVQGVALIVRPSPGGRVDPEVAAAITERIGRMPVAFLVVVAAFILAELILSRGKLGARFYAVGASPEAARAAGIGVDRLRFAAYVFSGLMAALAGLIIAARIGSGDPQAGTAFTLASVTAVVIGGTSVFGGVGTAVGTFLGAMLIILMQNMMTQFQINAYWQFVWTGVLTLLAVGFHSFRSAERRLRIRVATAGLLRGRRRKLRGRKDG